jgi:hypothetical protein
LSGRKPPSVRSGWESVKLVIGTSLANPSRVQIALLT